MVKKSKYNSHYVVLGSKDGKPLNGGVLQHRSSRFERTKDAIAYANATVELNGGPSRCTYAIMLSDQPPEIFVHGCEQAKAIEWPNDTATFGGRCPGCEKILTVRDAREAGKRECQKLTLEATVKLPKGSKNAKTPE